MCMQPKGEAYMIIVNRHTKEHLNLDYPKFRKRLVGRVRSDFAKQNTQTRLTPTNKHNSFGNSAWYIERM